MNNDKPMVAVTGPERQWKPAWWFTRMMLSATGVDCCYLTSKNPEPPRPLDGIVLGGGTDIEPIHYGRRRHPMRYYDKARDLFELKLLEQSFNQGIPVFGICRGMQMINVFLSGSLHKEIRPYQKNGPIKQTPLPIKETKVSRYSRLFRCTEKDSMKVNNIHRQGVDRLGFGLRVTARDEDNLIQAIEGEQNDVIGVQWHPEYLPYLSHQRKLFGCFANLVRKTDEQLSPKRLATLDFAPMPKKSSWKM